VAIGRYLHALALATYYPLRRWLYHWKGEGVAARFYAQQTMLNTLETLLLRSQTSDDDHGHAVSLFKSRIWFS